MTLSASHPKTQSLLLDVSDAILHATPEQFELLCNNNPDLRLERSKEGELIVMPPTGGDTGKKNLDLAAQVWYWNRQTELGEAFDSSTGYNFTAIDGGILSPDVSWIEKSRLEGIAIDKFIPIVPDFVIELRSDSDRLKVLQDKMLEYRRLGVKLGLLIDPQDRQVTVYRVDRDVKMLDFSTAEAQHYLNISLNKIMPNFELDLSRIW